MAKKTTAPVIWFPTVRKDQHALITTTTTFMSDTENRTRIGFEAGTHLGIWYDSTFFERLLVYNTNYALWDDPKTSTLEVRNSLNDSENYFFPVYRKFHNIVAESPLVTNTDLEEMGFSPRSPGSRSQHPVDTMSVNLKAKSLGDCIIEVSFENRDTGSSVVSYYLSGVMLFFEVSKNKTPALQSKQLKQSVMATQSPHHLSFEPKQRGMWAHIAGRCQNQRGERGPWSAIITIAIR
jgi:hypothetical protein